MGKSKRNKKINRNAPTGLPSMKDAAEAIDKELGSAEPTSSSVASVIESVRNGLNLKMLVLEFV